MVLRSCPSTQPGTVIDSCRSRTREAASVPMVHCRHQVTRTVAGIIQTVASDEIVANRAGYEGAILEKSNSRLNIDEGAAESAVVWSTRAQVQTWGCPVAHRKHGIVDLGTTRCQQPGIVSHNAGRCVERPAEIGRISCSKRSAVSAIANWRWTQSRSLPINSDTGYTGCWMCLACTPADTCLKTDSIIDLWQNAAVP